MADKQVIDKVNYSFKRGDSRRLRKFKILDLEQKEIVLSENDNIYFTIKPMEENIALVKKSIGKGIYLGEDNFYHIPMLPEDTQELEPDTYRYDIELNLNLETLFVRTIVEGTIDLTQDVTEKEDRG